MGDVVVGPFAEGKEIAAEKVDEVLLVNVICVLHSTPIMFTSVEKV